MCQCAPLRAAGWPDCADYSAPKGLDFVSILRGVPGVGLKHAIPARY